MMITEEQYLRLDWIIQKSMLATTLTKWEQNFIDDIAEKAMKYGEGIVLSDKQWETIEAIGEKL